MMLLIVQSLANILTMNTLLKFIQMIRRFMGRKSAYNMDSQFLILTQ